MSLSCCWNRSKQKSGENKTLSTFGLMDPPTSPAAQNPSSLHSDSIISSLLSFHASTPFSIACSFDRELEKALASASDDASVQDRLLNRTIQLASLLLDSTERCFRKRASAHNSVAWVLPPELTVKVFSKLDTKSLMQAAACCTLFNKCAMDRSSYAHIDLTTADNEVVCTMIHRAGKELRSIKLGHVTRRYGPEPNPNPMWFNPNPLSSLSYNHGFLGSRLTSLRLYNVGPMHYNSLSSVLSVCSNLTDLRIVGSPFVLCFMWQQFSIYESIYDPVKKMSSDRAPVLSEPSPPRDLGNSCKESPLETLIMRNCVKLEEKEVLELCNTLLKGNFKFIRHIDVSSNNGLVSDDGRRSYKPKFPVEKLKEERPDVTLVADFPLERSGKRYHVGVEGDDEELREIEMMDAKNDEEENDDDDSFEAAAPLIGRLVKLSISSASCDDDSVQDLLIDRESILHKQFQW
uniref:F-box domain-containing protein n=1 Tax=Brassica oleracea var. oleracea TaxID=109376 RepID=A0A0D3B8R7_BRAOL